MNEGRREGRKEWKERMKERMNKWANERMNECIVMRADVSVCIMLVYISWRARKSSAINLNRRMPATSITSYHSRERSRRTKKREPVGMTTGSLLHWDCYPRGLITLEYKGWVQAPHGMDAWKNYIDTSHSRVFAYTFMKHFDVFVCTCIQCRLYALNPNHKRCNRWSTSSW